MQAAISPDAPLGALGPQNLTSTSGNYERLAERWSDPGATPAQLAGLLDEACALPIRLAAQHFWTPGLASCMLFVIKVAMCTGLPPNSSQPLGPDGGIITWTETHRRLARTALEHLCERVFRVTERDGELFACLVADIKIVEALIQVFRVVRNEDSGHIFFPGLLDIEDDERRRAAHTFAIALAQHSLGYSLRDGRKDGILLAQYQSHQRDFLDMLWATNALTWLLKEQRYRLLTPGGWEWLRELACLPGPGQTEPVDEPKMAELLGRSGAILYCALDRQRTTAIALGARPD